ncbi:DUF481 domain-containing protein [Gammaproteobacteria bacterium LSUCC0057]|uniref:DUF481 domain-containing protein n=1 Tax=Gammaproteobacteria bacterium LSUCC0057 TaxID=2559237 RepID=A0A4Y8UJJ8_9GAMM|nr:DUF481 domain-containing protein [Gammaproteobacteria bacterium LSUCC0057]
MLRKIIALPLLLLSAQSMATVIVQGLNEEVEGWVFKLAGSFAETTGKTEKTAYGASYSTEYNNGLNQFRSHGSLSYNETNGSTVSDNQLVHLRYVRKELAGPLRGEFFYQNQANDVNLVAERELVGGGLSYRDLNEQLSYHVMVGVMNEKEQHLTDSSQDRDVERMTISTQLQWTFKSKNRLNVVIYHQPNISEFDDYRTTLESTLIVPLGEHVDINFSYANNMNTTPFGDVPKRSTNFETSISYRF